MILYPLPHSCSDLAVSSMRRSKRLNVPCRYRSAFHSFRLSCSVVQILSRSARRVDCELPFLHHETLLPGTCRANLGKVR